MSITRQKITTSHKPSKTIQGAAALPGLPTRDDSRLSATPLLLSVSSPTAKLNTPISSISPSAPTPSTQEPPTNSLMSPPDVSDLIEKTLDNESAIPSEIPVKEKNPLQVSLLGDHVPEQGFAHQPPSNGNSYTLLTN